MLCFKNEDAPPTAVTCLVILPLLGTNLSEWLNIQKREAPSCGPSFTNSWPSPLPHLPHRTWEHKPGDVIPLAHFLLELNHAAMAKRPWRRSESPSFWWRCPLWWCQWRPARGTSGRTWTDWRTVDGYTGRTRTYLRGKSGVKKPSHRFIALCRNANGMAVKLYKLEGREITKRDRPPKETRTTNLTHLILIFL